jgi:ribonuclease III
MLPNHLKKLNIVGLMTETTLEKPFHRSGSPLANKVLSYLKNPANLSSEDVLENLISMVCEDSNVKTLLLELNLTFNEPKLILNILSHSSFIHENPYLEVPSNEILEFFGDSILGTVISSHLVEFYPELNEGDLSRFRSSLVNESSLAELARVIMLGNCLLVGQGELKSGGFDKDSLLADSFEALLGGIYRDQGFAQVFKSFQMILELYELKNKEPFIRIERLLEFDCKTRLQEEIMALYKVLPVYKSKALDGQKFEVELEIKGKTLLSIVSDSKKKAQKELAKKVLNEKLYLNL